MSLYYVLDEQKRPMEVSFEEWGKAFENMNTRRVASSYFWFKKVCVSTVFLGLDHNFLRTGPPVLFETMIFGVPFVSEWQRRYCTWDEAVDGHKAACRVAMFPVLPMLGNLRWELGWRLRRLWKMGAQ